MESESKVCFYFPSQVGLKKWKVKVQGSCSYKWRRVFVLFLHFSTKGEYNHSLKDTFTTLPSNIHLETWVLSRLLFSPRLCSACLSRLKENPGLSISEVRETSKLTFTAKSICGLNYFHCVLKVILWSFFNRIFFGIVCLLNFMILQGIQLGILLYSIL